MSIHQHGTLGDTLYFWVAANDTSGSGADGSSAVVDVRLAGGVSSASPIHSTTGTLLTSVNYPNGCWEVDIVATSANGFTAGDTCSVFLTMTVDSQTPTGFIGSFTLAGQPANVTQWNGTDVTDALLTAKDVTLIYESNITTVNSQTSYDCSASVILDDNWIGMTCAIEDISSGDTSVRYISDVDAANNRLIVNSAPGFTVTAASPDKVRVWASPHPEYFTESLGVNVSKINDVTVLGAGTSGDKWRA